MKLTATQAAAMAFALGAPFTKAPAGRRHARRAFRRAVLATRQDDGRITYLHATKGWRSRRFPLGVPADYAPILNP